MTRLRRLTLGLLVGLADLAGVALAAGALFGPGTAPDARFLLTGGLVVGLLLTFGAHDLSRNCRRSTWLAAPLLAGLDVGLLGLVAPDFLSPSAAFLVAAGSALGRELVMFGAALVPGAVVAATAGQGAFESARRRHRLAAARSRGGDPLVLDPEREGDRVRAWSGPGCRLEAPEVPARGMSARLKRNMDLLAVLIALPVVIPVLAVLALVVRVTDGGPAFYRQRRLTDGGRSFWIWKIRSMRRDAEASGRPEWPRERDDRITPLGGWLRRLWLDELPQIGNVLRGDLSLIGPRPERPEFAQVFSEGIPKYRERYMARAGITGLAQALGFVGNTSLRKRTFCDRLYVRLWSPCLDIGVALGTLGQFVKRKHRRRFEFEPGRDSVIP
ncbi:MAG: sugar transferase [Planctomycetota bacterium]